MARPCSVRLPLLNTRRQRCELGSGCARLRIQDVKTRDLKNHVARRDSFHLRSARTSRRAPTRNCSRAPCLPAKGRAHLRQRHRRCESRRKRNSTVVSLGRGKSPVRRRRPRTVPRKTSRPRHFLTAERWPLDSLDNPRFLLGNRRHREPMHLACRTRPILGRTINSCVLFLTNRLLSRFVSSREPENRTNSRGRMQGRAGLTFRRPRQSPIGATSPEQRRPLEIAGVKNSVLASRCHFSLRAAKSENFAQSRRPEIPIRITVCPAC
jgi:hypothetical protein